MRVPNNQIESQETVSRNKKQLMIKASIIALLLIIFIFLMSGTSNSIPRKAVTILNSTRNEINGVVRFSQNSPSQKVEVEIEVTNLEKGKKHGFHIHELGDLSEGCNSTLLHWNPDQKKHGDLGVKNSHAGDFGSLEVDSYGRAYKHFNSSRLSLYGDLSIIGRALVLHEKEDDLGMGSNEASLINGNSGSRIACGIIGIAKDFSKLKTN